MTREEAMQEVSDHTTIIQGEMRMIPAHGAKIEITLDDLDVALDYPMIMYNNEDLERYVTPPITFSVSFTRRDMPYQITLSRFYEIFNGRCLPGSLKTKRLRKKRNKAVINWFIGMDIK